ncbi:MAG TPA: hypothetical protein VGR47_08835 [Terracidiphilus sp.]|nr:hypothetical protein [Terracidiphilus sp.]
MKPARWFLTIVAGIGLVAIAAPNAHSQMPTGDVDSYSAPEPAVYQPVTEAMPVKAVLKRFDHGLAMHDVGLLQAAGVNRSDAKRWREFFRENPQATVTDECPISGLSISDESASWTCTETATIVSEGRPRSFVHVIRFMFAKTNGEWSVAYRR